MSPILSALVVLCPSHLGTGHTPLITITHSAEIFNGDIMDTQAHTHPHTYSEGSILIGLQASLKVSQAPPLLWPLPSGKNH